MDTKCAVCGKAYQYMKNVGSLKCMIEFEFDGKHVRLATCHIDAASYPTTPSWVDCLDKLGKPSSMTAAAAYRNFSGDMDPRAITDPSEHNRLIAQYVSRDRQPDLYNKLKLPETDSFELASLIYYYQFDWRVAIPIILKLTVEHVIQASQPTTRTSYYYKSPATTASRHIYNTLEWSHATDEQKRRIIDILS